jgi:hypothetical protein
MWIQTVGPLGIEPDKAVLGLGRPPPVLVLGGKERIRGDDMLY